MLGFPSGAPMGSTAPAMGQPDDSGMQARAATMADLGMKALMQALQMAGPSTEQGQALVGALKIVGKAYPSPTSEEFSQAELKLLASKAAQQPSGPPSQDAGAFIDQLGIGAQPAPQPAMAQ